MEARPRERGGRRERDSFSSSAPPARPSSSLPPTPSLEAVTVSFGTLCERRAQLTAAWIHSKGQLIPRCQVRALSLPPHRARLIRATQAHQSLPPSLLSSQSCRPSRARTAASRAPDLPAAPIGGSGPRRPRLWRRRGIQFMRPLGRTRGPKSRWWASGEWENRLERARVVRTVGGSEWEEGS